MIEFFKFLLIPIEVSINGAPLSAPVNFVISWVILVPLGWGLTKILRAAFTV